MNPQTIVDLLQDPIHEEGNTLSCKAQLGDDYPLIFVPNSALAVTIFEGMLKAGWDPEGVIP
jgi:hypothetical protein